MAGHRFTVVIEQDEEGFFAFCPELQGCYTQGATYEEALEKDAIRLHLLGDADLTVEKFKELLK
ncbi:MAG: type II toxin-antitoxin system HicB family antitoxin [Thermoproteota archaeon]